jgi:hypothetical protein
MRIFPAVLVLLPLFLSTACAPVNAISLIPSTTRLLIQMEAKGTTSGDRISVSELLHRARTTDEPDETEKRTPMRFRLDFAASGSVLTDAHRAEITARLMALTADHPLVARVSGGRAGVAADPGAAFIGVPRARAVAGALRGAVEDVGLSYDPALECECVEIEIRSAKDSRDA